MSSGDGGKKTQCVECVQLAEQVEDLCSEVQRLRAHIKKLQELIHINNVRF